MWGLSPFSGLLSPCTIVQGSTEAPAEGPQAGSRQTSQSFGGYTSRGDVRTACRGRHRKAPQTEGLEAQRRASSPLDEGSPGPAPSRASVLPLCLSDGTLPAQR